MPHIPPAGDTDVAYGYRQELGQEQLVLRKTSLSDALAPRLTADQINTRLLALLGMCLSSGITLLSTIAAFSG
jgi:hypothetical protein